MFYFTYAKLFINIFTSIQLIPSPSLSNDTATANIPSSYHLNWGKQSKSIINEEKKLCHVFALCIFLVVTFNNEWMHNQPIMDNEQLQ